VHTAAQAVIDKIGGGDPEKSAPRPTEALKEASIEFLRHFPRPSHVHTPAPVWSGCRAGRKV